MATFKKAGLLKSFLAGIIAVAAAAVPVLEPSAWAGSKDSVTTEIEYTGEHPVYPGYPKTFNIVGRIDRMTAGEVVIDDSRYRIAAAATYHKPKLSNTLQSELKVNDLVGCLTDANGEIESIWFITRNAR